MDCESKESFNWVKPGFQKKFHQVNAQTYKVRGKIIGFEGVNCLGRGSQIWRTFIIFARFGCLWRYFADLSETLFKEGIRLFGKSALK